MVLSLVHPHAVTNYLDQPQIENTFVTRMIMWAQNVSLYVPRQAQKDSRPIDVLLSYRIPLGPLAEPTLFSLHAGKGKCCM